MTLPVIPLHDGTNGGTLSMMEAEPERLESLMSIARDHYSGLGLKVGDVFVKRWLARNVSPYARETDAVARKLPVAGGYALNASYDWACTTRTEVDPQAGGMRILRTLDWMLDGLGKNVCVLKRGSAAGDYYDITWPGAVGITSAMAPGRFAAMINQPPLRRHSDRYWVSWAHEHRKMWKRSAISPLHLLRQVFDTCKTYDDAKAMLRDSEICIPVFYTLCGTEDGQGCVIERSETEAHVFDGTACVSNHWRGLPESGHIRGQNSPERLRQMTAYKGNNARSFDWVSPPVLNADTRLAVIANPSSGELVVRGYEKDGPATEVFDLQDRLAAMAAE